MRSYSLNTRRCICVCILGLIFLVVLISKMRPWCDDLRDYYPLVIDFEKLKKPGALPVEPINVHRYQYLYKSSHVCKEGESVYLLTIVKSKVDHLELRQAIRDTWGKKASSGHHRLVFALGYSYDTVLMDKVYQEFRNYGDIIQETFVDHYFNNTLKTTMSIRWTATFCSNARHVFFVDDDVVVNFRKILDTFDTLFLGDEPVEFAGNVLNFEPPVRNIKKKWYVSVEEYPFKCYPPFTSGGAMLFSGVVIDRLNQAIPYVKHFRLDDVFLGIVAHKLGIQITHLNYFSLLETDILPLNKCIVKHGYSNYSSFIKAYHVMNNIDNKKKI